VPAFLAIAVGLVVVASLVFVSLASATLISDSGMAFAISFLPAAATWVFLLFRRIRQVRYLSANGIQTEAKLTQVQPSLRTPLGGVRQWTARYEYEVAGRRYAVYTTGDTQRHAERLGERVIVLVDPRHLSRSIILRPRTSGTTAP
jgi:hypothetical protein